MWTRSGRGYHARQANLEAEPRPSPKHRTLRLPNDDHDEIHMSADWLLLSSAFIRVQPPAPYVLAQYFRFVFFIALAVSPDRVTLYPIVVDSIF